MARRSAAWYTRLPIPLRFGIPAVTVVFTALFALWSIAYYNRAAYQDIEEDALERITADLTAFQRTLEFLYASGAERQVQREMVNRGGRGEIQERFLIDEHDRVIAASREALLGMALPEALARVREPVLGFAARVAEVRRRLTGQSFLTAGGTQVAGLFPVILGMKPGGLRPNRVGILYENRDLALAKALSRHEVRQRSLLLGSAFAIFALLLALLLHYYITRRVGKLVAAAQRFAQGELQARSGLGGRDEISQAGAAFDAMAERVGAEMQMRKEAEEAARAQERRIEHLAFYDALTGIPNRALLLDRLGQVLAQSERDGTQVAVLFTDLDHFKTINDTLGHPAGDELLRQAASRLRTVLREGDTVARLGGDEFVILLPRCSSARDAAQVAAKALGALSAPFTVSGHELHVTTSLGVSLFPRDGADAETLLKHADIALYQAKDRGRNQYQFFDAGMNTQDHERLLLDNGEPLGAPDPAGTRSTGTG